MHHDSFSYNYPHFSPVESVFTDRQLSEILYSLEGKKEIPLKYSYFENGIKNWNDRSTMGIESMILTESTPSKFNMFATQYKIIQQTIDMVLATLKHCDKINVIDVGCGNGWPVYPILSHLKESEQLGKYIAVDIVQDMTKLAIRNLTEREDLDGLETVSYVHDFEDGHFADFIAQHREENVVNLFCFFSNTLGNMVDRGRALANLRDTMTKGDLLWIGNTLYSNTEKLADFYNSLEVNGKEYLSYHKNMLTFFETFGMNWPEFGKVHILHEDQNGLLNYYFIVEKGFVINIDIDSRSESVVFHPGDKVKYCKLKNYREADLIEELNGAGFRVKLLTVSDDYRAALVLVSVHH